MAGRLSIELMDELFAGIEKEVEIKPDPVYASDKQRGYMNYRGVEPEVYTRPFQDRKHLNEVIVEAVKFSNEFARTHLDEKKKPQQPASGENCDWTAPRHRQPHVFILKYSFDSTLV